MKSRIVPANLVTLVTLVTQVALEAIDPVDNLEAALGSHMILRKRFRHEFQRFHPK